MGSLIKGAGSLLAYLAVATLLSQLVLAVAWWTSGRLDGHRAAQMMQLLQGGEFVSAAELAKAKQQAETTPVAFDDLAAGSATKLRDLELREQSLRQGLESLEAKRLALLTAKQDFEAARVSFDKQLNEMRAGALAAGEENVRSILASAKPKQAKELLLLMIEQGEIRQVVNLLGSMAATKRTKIISEFKTADETKQMDEILRLMRQGQPDVDLIDEAQNTLATQQPQATQN